MKRLLIISILLSLLLWGFGYAEDSWQRSFHWSMGPWGFGAGFFIIPLLLMSAFWMAVIIGIIYFFKWIASIGKGREIKQEDTALDILKKRYARGEISKEEFERIKQDIL